MMGRQDLEEVMCPTCRGQGADQRNRNRRCPACFGTGKADRCMHCGGIYGVQCKDEVLDQTWCMKGKDQFKTD